ncbi:peptidylprolyl isomerase [Geobacter hydrogenophilus]|uniref:peptidylprolyl isomerase n=1 Tax=Geobacter hydrogenophilus TaxID=40983 RepID=UPI001BDB2180|nr:peptidylprolyl isomerase [Geobacter hydrogenophilus]MBT0895733.1 peptidylprolyl isomerase [Geobacter hydrogenophilus]
MRFKSSIAYGLFLLGLMLAFQLLQTSVSADEVKEPRKVVARVNGVPIYEDALESHLAALANKGRASGFVRNPAKMDDYQKKKALYSLIDAELLRQASSTQHVSDLDAKVSKRLQEVKGKFPNEEAFLNNLRARGKTLDIFMAELRDGVRYDEYLTSQKIIGVPVPDDEIQGFYRNNPKSFSIPEQIKVRHILIEPDGSTADAVAKAEKKAGEIRSRVIKDKDFAGVAKEVSACATSSSGGDLGYISRGSMPPEFDKVAFSLKINDVSEPVRTKFGFHIIEVLDKKPMTVRPLAEVREFISRYLQRFDDEKRLNAHTLELRKKATIEVLLEEGVDNATR